MFHFDDEFDAMTNSHLHTQQNTLSIAQNVLRIKTICISQRGCNDMKSVNDILLCGFSNLIIPTFTENVTIEDIQFHVKQCISEVAADGVVCMILNVDLPLTQNHMNDMLRGFRGTVICINGSFKNCDVLYDGGVFVNMYIPDTTTLCIAMKALSRCMIDRVPYRKLNHKLRELWDDSKTHEPIPVFYGVENLKGVVMAPASKITITSPLCLPKCFIM